MIDVGRHRGDPFPDLKTLPAGHAPGRRRQPAELVFLPVSKHTRKIPRAGVNDAGKRRAFAPHHSAPAPFIRFTDPQTGISPLWILISAGVPAPNTQTIRSAANGRKVRDGTPAHSAPPAAGG